MGSLGLLAAVSYGTARFMDEPVRRYLENQVNQRLTGYTVRIRALRVHPWIGSFELHDATLVQDADPDPPVTRIARLVTSIDWRALLRGRVVADITFDHPTAYLNLKNVRAEAASDVALKDRGWQQALEALAFDLKINRLRVLDGDLTYVDQGPFKPLHVSRLDLRADNIRNIRSKERVYPSDIHLEGRIFDAGSLWLDGRADFLAEPRPGVRAALRLDRVALDYLKPITSRYNLSVDHGTLSLAGAVEYTPKFARLVLDQVLVQGVALEYRHLPHTAQAEQARVQKTARAAKEVAGKSDTELRIDRLDVVKSTFGFIDQAATPAYQLVLTDTDIAVRHLSNQGWNGRASVRLTGQLMGRGDTEVTATLQPRTGSADMNVTAQIEGADLVRLRRLIRAYGGFDIAAGEASVYSELQMKRGAVSGYVKPLFRGIEVGDAGEVAHEKGLGRRLYEGMVGIAAKILKNRHGEVATTVPVSGHVDHPQISRWQAVAGLLRNAFLEAIRPGFEPEQSPTGGSPPVQDGDNDRDQTVTPEVRSTPIIEAP